jgi:hypothetical protein
VDDFTRESLTVRPSHHFGGDDVVAALIRDAGKKNWHVASIL